MMDILSGTSWTFVPPPGGANVRPGTWRRDAAPVTALDAVRATIVDDTIEVVATHAIDDDDPQLQAHYPSFRIFPGVFVIESLRQAVGAIVVDPEGQAPEIVTVQSVRFLAPLRPGDRLQLAATLRRRPDGVVEADATARRDDGRVAVRLKVDFGHLASSGVPHRVAVHARLPHGHPMRLVDRVVALTPGISIVAIKAVTCTEPCYRNLPPHVPADRVAYPTSLMLESFGQAAAHLWLETVDVDAPRTPEAVVMLVSARRCRIEGRAYPGDVLTHMARIERIVGDTVLVEGTIRVGKRRVATIDSMIASRRSAGDLTSAGLPGLSEVAAAQV